MPGIVRVGLDAHVGHASPTPNPFHSTPYATGASKVFINGAKVVRIGDTTGCGDPAAAGSSYRPMPWYQARHGWQVVMYILPVRLTGTWSPVQAVSVSLVSSMVMSGSRAVR